MFIPPMGALQGGTLEVAIVQSRVNDYFVAERYNVRTFRYCLI